MPRRSERGITDAQKNDEDEAFLKQVHEVAEAGSMLVCEFIDYATGEGSKTRCAQGARFLTDQIILLIEITG